MSDPDRPFQNAAVESVFAGFPEAVRTDLLALRALIFATADRLPGVGRIGETLKWGQPAYLTPDTKSGSTIRLGATKQGGFAIYTHCQTTIMSDFQSLFPDDFAYETNRAVHFDGGAVVPADKIGLLIASALTYHVKRG